MRLQILNNLNLQKLQTAPGSSALCTDTGDVISLGKVQNMTPTQLKALNQLTRKFEYMIISGSYAPNPILYKTRSSLEVLGK